MTDTIIPASRKESKTLIQGARETVLHVCTSCREPGSPRDPVENRPGFKLYQALCEVLAESPLGHNVDIKPTQCLSLCPRPCAIALSSGGRWSYLFGDQRSDSSARDIVECISQYLDAPDGFMARKTRPKSLQASILGRVPPLDYEGADVPRSASQASPRAESQLIARRYR